MPKNTTDPRNLQQDVEKDLNHPVQDESSLHKCRTEIPNIVFDLDLDMYQFRLYMELKKIAGDSGKCWYSIPSLSKKLGMSERKIQYCKKFLSTPHPRLNNRPLIRIAKRKNNKENLSDVITIVDIWDLNFKKFYTGAQNDKDPGAQDAPPGAHCAPKKDPIEKDQEKKVSSAQFFGKYVNMPKEEYDLLVSDHSKDVIDNFVELINDHMASTGRRYKDFPATIRNWIRRQKSTINTKSTSKVPEEVIHKRKEWSMQHTWSTQGGYATYDDEKYIIYSGSPKPEEHYYNSNDSFWIARGL